MENNILNLNLVVVRENVDKKNYSRDVKSDISYLYESEVNEEEVKNIIEILCEDNLSDDEFDYINNDVNYIVDKLYNNGKVDLIDDGNIYVSLYLYKIWRCLR